MIGSAAETAGQFVRPALNPLTPHQCKTACNPKDHKPSSFPEEGQHYFAAGGSGALTGAAAGAAVAQLLQAGAWQLGAQLLHGAAQLGAAQEG